MAIFNKDNNKQGKPTNSETTVIATGATIKGDFTFDCRLHVDGDIEGTINSKNIIVIGKRGTIKGELVADKLVVNGLFEGSADCTQVEVLEGGIFTGNVLSEELMIEAKAKFQGESKIRTSESKNKDIPILDSIKQEIEEKNRIEDAEILEEK